MTRQTTVAHKLDNLYERHPIYVLSTGTSLRGFDFNRLNGRITIGVNRIIEHYHPTILVFVDVTAHQTHAAALRHYNGMIIAGDGAAPETHHNVFPIKHNVDTFELSGNMTALSTRVGRSFSDGWFGGGAGCTALHTAILLGGDPIYLLGYDYYEENGRHFDEYDPSRNEKDLYGISFGGLEHFTRQAWAPAIYNCNPRSRVTCFPFIDIDSVVPHAAPERMAS